MFSSAVSGPRMGSLAQQPTAGDENALAGICFIGPVTVIGSPVSSSDFMLAIKAGTAPVRAAIRPGLVVGEEDGSRGRLSRVPE